MQKGKVNKQNKQDEYQVESVIGKKVIDGILMYHVLWNGYPKSEATW